MEEQDQHRRDGAQLNHHLEHLIKIRGDLQLDKLVQQNHMSGGGNGQPFGDALYDAEEHRL